MNINLTRTNGFMLSNSLIACFLFFMTLKLLICMEACLLITVTLHISLLHELIPLDRKLLFMYLINLCQCGAGQRISCILRLMNLLTNMTRTIFSTLFYFFPKLFYG